MTEVDMLAAVPTPEANWTPEVDAQPLPGPSVWQQKATCFYSPDGSLVVAYPDIPLADGSGWQNTGMPDAMYSSHPQPPYYTAQAMNTSYCAQCQRSFASPNAVLQHLRDHPAHREGPEAYEAAYVLRCQEEGYYQSAIGAHWSPYPEYSTPMLMSGKGVASMEYDNTNGTGEDIQVFAPPSDIYTSSDSGSGGHIAEDTSGGCDAAARLTVAPQQPPAKAAAANAQPQKQQPAARNQQAGTKAARAPRGAGQRAQQGRGGAGRNQAAPPPKIEDESAFPPLGGVASPVATKPAPTSTLRKWAAAAASSGSGSNSSRKLRADATEYQPCSPPATPASPAAQPRPDPASSQKDEDAGSSVPTSPTSHVKHVTLRVSAPAWAPA